MFDFENMASVLIKSAANQSVIVKDSVHCVQNNLYLGGKRVRSGAGWGDGGGVGGVGSTT